MKEQINNCDGCQKGLKLVDGMHKTESAYGWTGCTKDLYASPTIQEEVVKNRQDIINRNLELVGENPIDFSQQEGKKCESCEEGKCGFCWKGDLVMYCSCYHSASLEEAGDVEFTSLSGNTETLNSFPEEAQEPEVMDYKPDDASQYPMVSSDWKEKEREAFIRDFGNEEKKYVGEYFEWFLSRAKKLIEAAREDERKKFKDAVAMSSESIQDWKEEGRSAALQSVREMLEGKKVTLHKDCTDGVNAMCDQCLQKLDKNKLIMQISAALSELDKK